MGITGDDPLEHNGNYGLYGVMDQKVYRFYDSDESNGISVFLRLVGNPADRNQIHFYTDTGVVFTGIFEGRPKDIFGIGFVYTGISKDAAQFDKDSGAANIRSYESLLELCYSLELMSGWTLQPNAKYIWNPGGTDTSNALVLGLRSTMTF